MRLTRDVTNPKADRRVKYDPLCKPVWKKGTVLLVGTIQTPKDVVDLLRENNVPREKWPREPRSISFGSSRLIHEDDPIFHLLLSNAEAVSAHEVDEILAETLADPEEVLRALVDEGFVKVEAVRVAAKAVTERNRPGREKE